MSEPIKPSPRGYLSWSQMSLWEKDPNLYYEQYVEGIKDFKNKYLELGKLVAEVLDGKHDDTNNPMIEMLRVFMPTYPLREHDLSTLHENIPLTGKLDGFDEENLIVGEYKTGKKWSQSKADKHGQLDFYALLVWKRYGKLPNKMFLHWAETREDEFGNLELTGQITTFPVVKTMKDVILITGRIQKAWDGITEMYKNIHG